MSFGRAIALAVERTIEPVEGMHRAISGRWFTAAGRIGAPVRTAHDTATHGIYQTIRLGVTAAGVGIDYATTVQQTTFDRTQAVVNGLWGDTLGRHERRLGITMGLRGQDGVEIPAGSQLEVSFPKATGHLVVLVHGFMDTEQCWVGNDSRPGLSRHLESDPLFTPLLVRYNTGQSMAASGAHLADLLETVIVDWPVPIESMALVGHSMGGLVIRAACASAAGKGHTWIADLSDVVTLGAPHLGTPLEKLTDLASRGLAVAKETRPLSIFLESRSRGVKDLRHGNTGTGDRSRLDPTALPVGIDHHFVAGVVTAKPTHPAGVVMGDLIVRTDSATGANHLNPTNVMVVGGIRHNDLLHEPVVADQVMEWLNPGRTRPLRTPEAMGEVD